MAAPSTLSPADPQSVPPGSPSPGSARINPWLFVPTLYFMQSLPYVLVTETFGTAHKLLGVENMQIALWTGLAALPWSFKMFWGPLVDLSFTKRQWTVAMQVLLTGALAVGAGAMLTEGFFAISVAMMFMIAVLSATHDIACDGLYLMSLDRTRQAAFSGVMATCSRMGRLFAASVIVYLGGAATSWGLSAQGAWAVALGVAATVYGAGTLWNLLTLPRPEKDTPVADVAPGERSRNLLRTLTIVLLGVCLYFSVAVAIELLGNSIFRGLHGATYDAAMALTDPAARKAALEALPAAKVPLRWHMTRHEMDLQATIGLSAAALFLPAWLWVLGVTRGSTMATAFVSYVRQPGFGAILGFIIFYRFGEAMIFSMTKLFMLDPHDKGGMGITPEELSLVNGLGQVGGLILGGLLGGWFISRVGLRRAFWPLVACMHVPNLLYVWIAYELPAKIWLYPIAFVEACGYGFGFAGYFVYLMYVAQREKGPDSAAGAFTTSHYAIGTGLGALFITFATILGGIVQSVFGYTGVFIAACLFTIPGTLVLLMIPMDETEGRGIKAHAES